jgi:two-component system, OmpR family, response regulator
MKILVAEDDPALIEALRFVLDQAGYGVAVASDGASADQALRDSQFDLLILDLTLPQLDGYEVLTRLRRRNQTLPVLILSGRETTEDKVLGLDLGADDYLAKPFQLNELQARVRALLRRNKAEQSAVLTYAQLKFDTVERSATVDGQTLALSALEIGLLEAFVRRFGRVISKDQLLEQLYHYDKDVSQNAIEVYVHRLRRKLATSGLVVRTLYGRGYVLEENRPLSN